MTPFLGVPSFTATADEAITGRNANAQNTNTKGKPTMRKPHQHECDGQRFDCADPNCRMPFKVTRQTPRPRRTIRVREKVASREVQHARYLDCGPQNWDDK